jgi:hypothetical protein
MKEISEALQWEIFELLEGNLSHEESLIILNKIKSDNDLEKYYSSLKQTYLQKDNAIIYPGKKSLIKKSDWSIFISPLKYAAAAVVVLCVSYLFYNNQTASVKTKSIVANNDSKRIEKRIESNKMEEAIPMKSTSIVRVVNQNQNPNSTQNIPLEKLSLNKFNKHKKQFNPSSKLIEESEFYNNLTANTYLSDEEKKQIMLKWLLIHSANYCACQDDCIDVQPTKNIAINDVEVKNDQQLSKQWIKEVKQMIKSGTIPKIKLVSSRKNEKWLPTFGIQVNTENASMVANIIK